MIAASTLGSWLWFYGEIQSPKNFVLAGAAFPLLLKKGISALVGDKDLHLGGEGEQSSFRDYLEIA